MSNPKYLAKVEATLTKEDWQYIYFATQQRFNSARPKLSEGKPSEEFLMQCDRIMFFLQAKAY